MMFNEDYYTTDKLAAKLKVTTTTVNKWVRNGLLKATNYIDLGSRNQRVFEKNDIEDFLANYKIKHRMYYPLPEVGVTKKEYDLAVELKRLLLEKRKTLIDELYSGFLNLAYPYERMECDEDIEYFDFQTCHNLTAIPISTLQKLCWNGILESIKVKNRIMISVSDLIEYVAYNIKKQNKKYIIMNLNYESILRELSYLVEDISELQEIKHDKDKG